ncbi:MAG: hypothetical protein K5872_22065 [Rhizobiaceae bacterium]|nr:hypothetical protein [Rhizobiaceae bacterium]MCV0408906.1 hypothetical protein [Rhizobiaceae bacterium]
MNAPVDLQALTDDFVARNLDGSGYQRCVARYAATGVVHRASEFIFSEVRRGTTPEDLLTAVTAIQSSILSAVMMMTLKRDLRVTGAEQVMDTLTKSVVKSIVEQTKAGR